MNFKSNQLTFKSILVLLLFCFFNYNLSIAQTKKKAPVKKKTTTTVKKTTTQKPTTAIKKAPVKKKTTQPVKKPTQQKTKQPAKKTPSTSAKKVEATQSPKATEEFKSKPQPNNNTNTSATQSKPSEEKRKVNKIKLADKFIVDLYLGFTSSFAKGDFIDYHKSFYDVSEPNTKIEGKINPVYFFSFGSNFYYAPFYNNKGALSKLGITFGIGYVKRGFASIYSSEHNTPNQNLSDRTVYTEKYRLNYLTRQLSLHYGKKVFFEIGLIKNNLLGSTRKQILEHEVSGSDAYAGGFKNKTKQTYSLDKSIMDKTGTGYIVGIGWRFSKSSYLRISFHNSGKVFNQGANFKNKTAQLQLSFPIYNHSFFKK